MTDHFTIDVRLPSPEEASAAQATHDQVLKQAVAAGFLHVDDVVPHLLAQGLWDAEKNARLQWLETAVSRHLDEIRWWSNKAVPAARLAEVQRERLILLQDWSELSRQTAEAWAARAQFHCLMSSCVRHATTGEAVFDDADDYVERIDDPIAIEAADKLSKLLELPVIEYESIVKNAQRF